MLIETLSLNQLWGDSVNQVQSPVPTHVVVPACNAGAEATDVEDPGPAAQTVNLTELQAN